MNIDATEIMVIAEMADTDTNVVELVNDQFNNYLCEQEVRLFMFNHFGVAYGVDWEVVRKK